MEKSIILLNFLNRFFRQKQIIKPNMFVLLAISGGQDSSFLFFLLLHFQNQWNLKFHLLWCNHLWQNESFYTMEHIFKLANFFQIPIYLVITEITVFSEQTARKWRLNTFQRIGFYSRATSILNGHTASDRIESALLNLLRGSGSEGLQNFDYQKNLKINKWKIFFMKSSKTSFQIFIKSIKKKKPNLMYFDKKKNLRNSPKITKSSLTLKKRSSFSYKINQNWHIQYDTFKISVLGLPTTDHYQNSFDLISKKVKNKKKFFFAKKVSFLKNNSVNFCKKNKKFSSTLQKIPCLDSNFFEKKNRFAQNKSLNLKNFVFSSKIITNKAIEHPVLCTPKKLSLELQNIKHIFFYHTFYIFLAKYQINTKCFIVRPLGTIQRFDIQQICGLWKTPLYPDQSNRAFRFMRNRIRNQILPTFRFFFNPQIDRLLYQFIEIQTKEQIYFYYLIERLVTNLEFKNKNYYILNINFFENLPLCLQRRVLRFFFKDFMSFHLKFSHIELLLNAIHKNKKISLNWDSNFLTSMHFLKKPKKFLSKTFKKSVLAKKNVLRNFICQTPIYFFFPKTGFSFLNLFLKVFF